MENNQDLEFKTGDELSNGLENLIDPHASEEETPIVDEELFGQLEETLSDTSEEENKGDNLENTSDNNSENTSTEEPKNNTETTAFHDLTSYLKEQGIFDDIAEYEDEDFKFDGSEDSFKELMERHSQKKAFEFLEKDLLPALPPSARKQVELLLQENLPANDAEELGDKISTYQSLTKDNFEKDLELAKKTYTEYLKSKGMDEDEIQELVDRAVDLEEIVDKADKAKEKLLKSAEKEIEARKEKAKIEEQKLAEANIKKLESIKASTAAFIKDVNQSGFKLSEKLAEKVFDSRTKPVGFTQDKKPINGITELANKDPEGFQNSLHLLSVLGFFEVTKKGEIKPNFSKLTKNVASETTKKTISTIDSITNKFKSGKSGSNDGSDDDSDDPILELKQLFKQ